MSKKGIFEYVNLQRKKLKSKRGAEYDAVIAVSDTPNELKPDSDVGKKLKELGFFWNGRWFQFYENQITDEMFDKIKEINAELNTNNSGEQTGEVEDFQSMLEEMKQEIAGARIPLQTKTELETSLENFINKIANATADQADAIFNQFVNFSNKLHNYSEKNKAYIYAQKPDATKVASESYWNKMGRQVVDRRNSAITINCGNKKYMDSSRGRPVEREYKLKQQNLDKEYEYKVKMGWERANSNREAQIAMRRNVHRIDFDACPVYDISDTVGADLPPETQGNWTAQINTNNDNSAVANTIFGIAKKSLEANGIQVTHNPATAGEAGWSRRGQINVSSDVTGTYAASTIFKEWAGDLLHQENGKFYDKTLKYFEEKGQLNSAQMQQVKMVQESAVAATICNHFGLPTDEHPTYMALLKAQGGLDSTQLIKENVSTISAVSSYIVKEIRKHENELNAVTTQGAATQQPQQ